MPRVQVQDEDVNDLLVVQPPPMLVLGLDQAIHHVHVRLGDTLRRRHPPLVQGTLQHRYQLFASLKCWACFCQLRVSMSIDVAY